MRVTKKWHAGLVAAAAAVLFTMTACGGGSLDSATKDNEDKADAAGGDCEEMKIIINPWVGYTADAYVVGTVAEQELGCAVEYVEV